MKVLYTSNEVRRAVRSAFGAGTGRRVAVVAFVGAGAEAYIPNPKGLDLYCWPSPSGTSAKALRVLQRLGVSVYFVRRLHMKLYWSAKRGVVITSANLSTNAYGHGDLKEAGVHLPSRAVDIDRVIRSLRATPATADAIGKLERAARKMRRQAGADGERPRNFAEWFDEHTGAPTWSLMPYSGQGPASKALVAAAKQDHGQVVIALNCSPGEVRPEQYLLTVDVTTDQPRTPEWIFVHRVVKVKPSDPAYERGFSYQAGQLFPTRSCPLPPFAVDAAFRQGLRRAPKVLGPKRTGTLLVRGRPRSGLLKVLRELYEVEASR